MKLDSDHTCYCTDYVAFATLRDMKLHVRTEHPEELREDKERNKEICPHCAKKLDRKNIQAGIISVHSACSVAIFSI